MQYRSYFVNRTSNGVAVGPTITRRRNGRGCLSPLAENGMRYRVDNAKSPSYEFEVSTAERSDDDNARSVCKGEGQVPRALSVTHSRATSTTHFAFTSLPRRLRPLPLHLVGHDRTTILFSRRHLSSARTDGVRTAWDTRYFHLATPIDYSRAWEGMLAGMFDASARQTLSTFSLARILLSDIQRAPFL